MEYNNNAKLKEQISSRLSQTPRRTSIMKGEGYMGRVRDHKSKEFNKFQARKYNRNPLLDIYSFYREVTAN